MGDVNFTQIPPLAKKTVFNYQPLGKEKAFFIQKSVAIFILTKHLHGRFWTQEKLASKKWTSFFFLAYVLFCFDISHFLLLF